MNDFYRVSWFKGNDSLWTWLRNVLKEILMLSKNLHPCPQRPIIKPIVLKHVQGRRWGVFSLLGCCSMCSGKIRFITLTNRIFNTGNIFICEWVHRNTMYLKRSTFRSICILRGWPTWKNVLFSKREKHWLFQKISNVVR